MYSVIFSDFSDYETLFLMSYYFIVAKISNFKAWGRKVAKAWLLVPLVVFSVD
jgi:hypothetical protein